MERLKKFKKVATTISIQLHSCRRLGYGGDGCRFLYRYDTIRTWRFYTHQHINFVALTSMQTSLLFPFLFLLRPVTGLIERNASSFFSLVGQAYDPTIHPNRETPNILGQLWLFVRKPGWLAVILHLGVPTASTDAFALNIIGQCWAVNLGNDTFWPAGPLSVVDWSLWLQQ